MFIFIIVCAVVLIGALFFIYNIRMCRKQKQRDDLKHLLVYKKGIVKAENFSCEELDSILDGIKKRKQELEENPLIIYDIVFRSTTKYK